MKEFKSPGVFMILVQPVERARAARIDFAAGAVGQFTSLLMSGAEEAVVVMVETFRHASMLEPDDRASPGLCGRFRDRSIAKVLAL